MRGELFFEIPDDQQVRVKLVEAVPSNWSWVEGGLHASKNLIVNGQVEKNIGFAVERFSIHPIIFGYYDRNEGKWIKPDLFAITVELKMPRFITFDEAGYDAHIITLELAKRIAIDFIRKDYRGSLHFYGGCHNNIKYENPARCSMVFESWNNERALVKLKWESRYYGKEEDIAAIVAACHSLNLREYVPVAPAENAAL